MSYKVSEYNDWWTDLQVYLNEATTALALVANQNETIVDDNLVYWLPVSSTNWNSIALLPNSEWNNNVYGPAVSGVFVDSIVSLFALANLKYANEIKDPLCPPMPTDEYVFGAPASAGCMNLFNGYFNATLPEYNTLVDYNTTTVAVSGTPTLVGNITVYNPAISALDIYLDVTLINETVSAINAMSIKTSTPSDRILYILLKKPSMVSNDVDIEDILLNTYRVKDVLDEFSWTVQGFYP